MLDVAADARQRFEETKAKVRAAWVVFARIPDLDARFRRGLRGGWIFPIVRDAGESYGWNPPWLRPVASPKEMTEMETVLEWMAWLRRQTGEGDLAIRRIMRWATGTPTMAIAAGEGCTAHTIRNRIDCGIAKVMREFEGVAFVVAADPAPEDFPGRRAHDVILSKKPPVISDAPDSLLPGKVYIDQDGFGLMFHGARYDSDGGAIDRMRARGKRR